MLQKLKVKNYQSHEDSELEFTEGINVIVGSSDSGKSALLRAIKFVVFNRPLGSGFISKGSKDCVVDITTHKGIINRTKGGSNVYTVNGKLYRAFGNSVPDTVCNVLNLSDINYQAQLSGHFLVLQSSGEVAKELNKSLNIDMIDLCSSKCSSEIRSYNKQLKVSSERRDEIENKLEAYNGLNDLVEKIEKLEVDKEELEVLEEEYVEITNILISINDILAQLKKTEKKLFNKKEVVALEKEVADTKDKIKVRKDLLLLVNSIHSVQETIKVKDKKLLDYDEEIEICIAQRKELWDSLEVCPLCGKGTKGE